MSLTISKTVPAGHSFVEKHQYLNSKLLVGVMLYMIKSCHRGVFLKSQLLNLALVWVKQWLALGIPLLLNTLYTC